MSFNVAYDWDPSLPEDGQSLFGGEGKVESERVIDLTAAHIADIILAQTSPSSTSEYIYNVNTAYKPVSKKKRPVDTTTPEESKPLMVEPSHIYADLPKVETNTRTIDEVPEGKRLTKERLALLFAGRDSEAQSDF